MSLGRLQANSPEPRALSGPFPFDINPESIHNREDVMQALQTAPELYSSAGALGVRIVRLTKDVVCKYGIGVTPSEAENMLAVNKTLPDFPTADLIDYWQVASTDDLGHSIQTTFLLQQYIQGQVLAKLGNRLTDEIKQDIRHQLRTAVQGLRTICSDIPGPAGRGFSKGTLFYDHAAGPFASKRALMDWLNQCLNISQRFQRAPVDLESFNSDVEALVMCHTDLHPYNLILDDHGKLWIIDWANAGYYLPSFEAASIRQRDDVAWYLSALSQDLSHEDRVSYEKLYQIRFGLRVGPPTKRE